MNTSFQNLRKSSGYKKVGGVASGVSYWLGLPVLVVRILWVVAVLFYGSGIILYALLWFVLPDWNPEPEDFKHKIGID